MRHMILLFLLALAAYVAWQVAQPSHRQSFKAAALKHGPRIIAIALFLLALLALAFSAYSPKLL